ncbi:MAG: hypothetical protein ACTHJ3_19145 [Pararhizobium sp.]
MIEFLLIFVLGFFAALLIVLVVSPVIGRRIAVLTERRVRATAPLSAAELRAEKDAARAVFAMENGRLSAEIRSQRERIGTTLLERERLAGDLARARSENLEATERLEAASREAERLQLSLQERDEHAQELATTVATLERAGEAKDRRIEDGIDAVERVQADLETARIDLATRDARIETLKSQIEMLRDERKRLREESKKATDLAHDLRNRLEREEERARTLDAKLAEAIATLSDQEGALERRAAEIARLKQGLNGHDGTKAAAVLPAPAAAQGHAGPAGPEEASEDEVMEPAPERETASPRHRGDAIARRIESLRSRHAAVVDALNGTAPARDDAELREEIGEIAAMMIELTAAREGPSSPIFELLRRPGAPEAGGRPAGLAERALKRLSPENADRDA